MGPRRSTDDRAARLSLAGDGANRLFQGKPLLVTSLPARGSGSVSEAWLEASTLETRRHTTRCFCLQTSGKVSARSSIHRDYSGAHQLAQCAQLCIQHPAAAASVSDTSALSARATRQAHLPASSAASVRYFGESQRLVTCLARIRRGNVLCQECRRRGPQRAHRPRQVGGRRSWSVRRRCPYLNSFVRICGVLTCRLYIRPRDQDVTSFRSPVINLAPAIIPRAHRVPQRAATRRRCPSPQYNSAWERTPCTVHPAWSEANHP
ncbi:hypothetical protein C8T65DRAFT_262525 [Cerioporus squamosus]|nr:hypothetical protein C8T65DRAFT_262525 [Cerioporus squamosus]